MIFLKREFIIILDIYLKINWLITYFNQLKYKYN